MFTEWITSQVGDDAGLLAKVIPDYPATGKRTLQDNGSWLKTLTRDNVELVRDGVDRIEPGAVVADGDAHNHDNLPLIMAGRAGGTIETGRHVRYAPETPMANLFVSMLQRMGIESDKFASSTGTMSGLQMIG